VATATAAFKNSNYKLLERAAGAVADAVLWPSRASVRSSSLRSKPHAPIAAIFEDVGVVLTRDNCRPMADVLIALGGNVGDVRTTFRKAIPQICGMTQAALLARSADYATPPWGDEQQAPFINACIEIETSLDPHALLFTLHKIEKKFGRDRAHERRWGPRTLDLDLIAYDDIRIDKPELTLPHPRLFERAFVLVPLAEIAPERLIAERSVKAMLAELPTEGILRLPDLD
jgi:2-amino-4-hydroxy-6-hydroxymethyldihydropteridine diphosphokinase